MKKLLVTILTVMIALAMSLSYAEDMPVIQWNTRAPEVTPETVDPEELLALGVAYFYGDGMEQSYDKAVEFLGLASDQGLADAQFILGYMYHFGEGVQQSYEKALEYYRLAADQGYAGAQFSLGYMYEYGEGVAQSYEKAIEYYQLAADQGVTEAEERIRNLQ